MLDTLRRRADSSPAVRFFRRLGAAGPSVLAAAIAYNLFFALVPAMASVVVAASVFGRSEEVLAESMTTLGQVAPSETVRFIGQVLGDVAQSVNRSQDIVVAATGIVALWLGSRGIHTIQEVLARIAEVEDRRPWILAKLISVLLTGGIAVTLVVSSLLVVGGAAIADRLDTLVGDDWPVRLWKLASVPVAAFCFFLFLAALYRWGPPKRFPGMWLASLLSTIGSVLASLGFRFYLDRAGATGATTLYFFGTVAVMLLWLYVIAYVIIVSGAIAASVARRAAVRAVPVGLAQAND